MVVDKKLDANDVEKLKLSWKDVLKKVVEKEGEIILDVYMVIETSVFIV